MYLRALNYNFMISSFLRPIVATCFLLVSLYSFGEGQISFDKVSKGLKFRSVGPALTSGRIVDLAVHPSNPAIYFVASAAGGVWKTANNGISFDPVFDSQGTSSIGCIEIDPKNPNIVWVGSGENNNQRSVGYGDGLYKSEDGGKSWNKVGLEKSEHIGMIAINPKDSRNVFVAAYGPLWSEGGERGVYETKDGGATWERVLNISEHTGCSEVYFDREDPKTLYAVAHQRRRHVFTYISGGPESSIYKSVDGGVNWEKITVGLPKGDLGRIGLALCPFNGSRIYAIVEAQENLSGFYISEDKGMSWVKQSGFSTSGNYYQEIFADPHKEGSVYAMNNYSKHSTDYGKSWKSYGNSNKHVDDHVQWIDPNFPDHHLVGCDGGLYETYDGGKLWQFKANLPVTQFYKVALDNSEPFYNIYGGTQDNFSLGGPSQTTNQAGILNSDWFITKGGDGFESQVDPSDPNIVYAQSQYGWLARFDKKTGEKVNIRPMEEKGGLPYRWNWDAPLIISPHNSKRLYFAANKLFKSENRGDSWTVVSPDLTKQQDRNTFEVMGQVWPIDAVAKNKGTSIYGNIVALSESPIKEGLLYVGTDDGLIQVSKDGGASWSQLNKFPGVPEGTYVNFLLASQHYENVVYAVFNNHKRGDFKPYLCVSRDAGKTWSKIHSNLPEKGSVYCLAEDHVNPDLIFVGTEFGVHFSISGGLNWTQMKSGLPTVPVRDMEISKKENDLVIATFGRGFYVLDDYTPLRMLDAEVMEQKQFLFPITEATLYLPTSPLGKTGKGFQGDALYSAENAPIAAVFSLYLNRNLSSLKSERKERQKSGDNSYPTKELIVQEAREQNAYLIFEIVDQENNIVRRFKKNHFTGMKRITWNLRYNAPDPVTVGGDESKGGGSLVIPGTYDLRVYEVNSGKVELIVKNRSFKVKNLYKERYSDEEYRQMADFHNKMLEMEKVIWGVNVQIEEMKKQCQILSKAVRVSEVSVDKLEELHSINLRLLDIYSNLNGESSIKSKEFEMPTTIVDRVGLISWGFWLNHQLPTKDQIRDFDIVKEDIKAILDLLQPIENDLLMLKKDFAGAGAPYIPGQQPSFKN